MNNPVEVWPLSSAISSIDGYFHKISWFSIRAWELNNSVSFLLHNNEQTWDPVLMEFKHVPVLMFQNFIEWSSLPPPEAIMLCWNGHHASALTVALWLLNLWSCWVAEFEETIDHSHMQRRWSFPPLANCRPVLDHFSPHTSWWWPLYVCTMWDLTLISLLIIMESAPPDVRMLSFQAREPTRPLCPPCKVLNCRNNKKTTT